MTKKTDRCLWEEVTSELVSYIENNKLKAGSSFFSADKISERFNISNTTSRRVLSELANMHLIEKSRGRGCVVKRQNSIETVFVMTGQEEEAAIQSFVFSELYKGVIEESRQYNINTKFISPLFFNNFPEDEKINLIILQNFPSDLPELAERLKNDENINCVCCHSLDPILGITTVRSDRKFGAYGAVNHLIRKGHEKIAFIGGGNPVWSAGRFDGYYQALKDNNITFDMRLVCNVELDKESHFAAMTTLMQHNEPPSAVFAVCDTNALFVLDYCQQNGIKVPEQLAVLGVDNIPESAHTKPPLTTVDTMLELQGREAVRLLLECLPKDKIKDKILKTKLIVRESA